MLNHVTYGKPADTALILIHALGADHTFWSEAGPALAERYFCIAPDIGVTPEEAQAGVPVGVEQRLADLDALRADLGVRRVAPIGCALGGLLGVRYAVAFPDRTFALVMTNPGLRNSEAAKARLHERIRMARSAGMRALIESSVDRCFNGLPHDARYERYLSQFTGQDPEAYAQTVISLLDLDITAIAAEVACPTLLVPGAHDVLMPAEDGPALARMIPDARLESMPAAAHFVPQQAPEPFAQMALAFLDAVIAGRGRKGSSAAPGG